MDKVKIIALFGKSGAGKDTIVKTLVSRFPNELNPVISCTTRPPRDYEKNGVDYYFIPPDMFAEKVLDGSMLEATCFNEWFYGTPIESLKKDKINIGVFNIQGVECLLQDSRLDVTPIYINVTDKIRLQRILNREENPNCLEVCRRFLTDEADFSDIPFEYETYDNNEHWNKITIINFEPIKKLLCRTDVLLGNID
jgi:guanylate kinase